MERSGAAAIVLPSLFEEEIVAEEIELNRSLEQGSEIFAEALDYFPAVDAFVGTADRYLSGLERIKAAVGGSGHRESERQHRRRMGPLRAAHPGRRSGRARTERVPHGRRPGPDVGRYGDGRPGAHRGRPCVHRIPLAVKLSPYYSAFANFAASVVDAGADGLVLFNRFYQPDLDLDTLDVVPGSS